MSQNRQKAFENDGMQHYYSTCPSCRCIVSDENIVFVDGRKMCRSCMSSASRKQESVAALPQPEEEP